MRRTEIGRALQDFVAGDNTGLYVRYQPKFDLSSGEIYGVEALVRWKHPELGIIQPDDFIDIAEQQNHVHKITNYVLEEVIRQSSIWYRNGTPLHTSVNVSPIDLLDENFPKRLSNIIKKYQLPSNLLELEITENIIIADSKITSRNLNRIRHSGVGIAIDDFGTGYSGFHNLRSLPFSTIKIDRGFIKDMLENEEDQVIVNGAIEIAHKLGMVVVAEGVETLEIAYALTEQGCDVAQGFFYSRAVKPEVINEKYLRYYSQTTIKPAAQN